MSDSYRYAELARRLEAYGYQVQPEGYGYLVRHRQNHADVSHARHLADLADLAGLIEWAARRHQQHRESAESLNSESNRLRSAKI